MLLDRSVIIKVSAVASLIAFAIACAFTVTQCACMAADVVVAKGGEYTAPDNKVQVFSGVVDIAPGDEQLPMTLTIENGPGTTQFQWLRCYLRTSVSGQVSQGGQPLGTRIVDEKATSGHDKVGIDLTGRLRAGKNSLVLQGAGQPGAKCSWVITRPQTASLLRLAKNEYGVGDVANISGSNFGTDTASLAVAAVNNRTKVVTALKIQSLSGGTIAVQIPPNLDGGTYTMKVTQHGTGCGAMPFTLYGMPHVTGSNLEGVIAGNSLVIYGQGFSQKPEDNSVVFETRNGQTNVAAGIRFYDGPTGKYNGPVTQASDTSISVLTPEEVGHYTKWRHQRR